MFDPEQKVRYDRQVRLWGADAQSCLIQSSILCLGVTGATAELLKNLTLSGVGQITILDDDAVRVEDISQNYFLRSSDVGNNRSVAVASRLKLLNPFVRIVPCCCDGERNQEESSSALPTSSSAIVPSSASPPITTTPKKVLREHHQKEEEEADRHTPHPETPPPTPCQVKKFRHYLMRRLLPEHDVVLVSNFSLNQLGSVVHMLDGTLLEADEKENSTKEETRKKLVGEHSKRGRKRNIILCALFQFGHFSLTVTMQSGVQEAQQQRRSNVFADQFHSLFYSEDKITERCHLFQFLLLLIRSTELADTLNTPTFTASKVSCRNVAIRYKKKSNINNTNNTSNNPLTFQEIMEPLLNAYDDVWGHHPKNSRDAVSSNGDDLEDEEEGFNVPTSCLTYGDVQRAADVLMLTQSDCGIVDCTIVGGIVSQQLVAALTSACVGDERKRGPLVYSWLAFRTDKLEPVQCLAGQ